MVRSGALAIGFALLAQSLVADDWPGPRVMSVFSEDGGRFVRVEPGQSTGDTVGFAGAPKGRYARGMFYVRRDDLSYVLSADIALQNPVAPVDLLLSNAGYLIAFDNWHNVGYGKVVTIYDPTGEVVEAWQLDQLYTVEQVATITQSISSRWWRCLPFHFTDPDKQTKVCVRESLGGYFVFDLATGGFTYHPGQADCQRPAGPFSVGYLGSVEHPP